MERNILILIVGLLTLLMIGGILFLLKSDVGEKPPYPAEASVEEPLEEKSAGEVVEEEVPDEFEREIVEPEEYIPDELRGMPASFRKALGGFKGRVVEEDATPTPDIKVEVLGGGFLDLFHGVEVLMGEGPLPYELKTSRTTTEKDGTFFLPGVYPQTFYVLGVDLEGPRAYLRILDRLPAAGEVVDLGDIVLPAFAILTGTVKDEQGNPVAGARVRATHLPPIVFMTGLQDYREGGSFLIQERSVKNVIDPFPIFYEVFKKLPLPTTFTNEDGSFRMEGVPKGLINVIVDLEEFVTAKQGPVSTAKGGEKDLGVITLSQGNTFLGKVLDHGGMPAAGVEIRAGSIHGFKEFTVLQPPVETGEDGAFSIPGFPSIPAMIAARRYPDDAWTVAGPFNPATENPVLNLPPSFDLRVVVVDEDDKFVRDARLKFRHLGPVSELSFVHEPKVPAERMERPGEGIFEIKGLPAGTYELLVTAPESAAVSEKVKVLDAPVEKRIILEPAHTAHVRVLREDDKSPVEWAEVYTSTDDFDWIARPTKISRSRTDETGLAVLKKLHKGKTGVTVSHPEFAVTIDTLEVPAEEEKLILLKPGGVVEGVVYPGLTQHQPPYMIIMHLRGSYDTGELEVPRLTATDGEGKFRVTNLPPGSWRIYVEQRIFQKDLSTLFDVVDRMDTLKRASVDVESGETTYVEIVLGDQEVGPTGEVLGRVTVDGAAAAGASVHCWINKRYRCTVDASGSYNLGKVSVGSGMLTVRDFPANLGLDSLYVMRNIQVEENLSIYEDFDILTGTITGRVVSESGARPDKKEFRIAASLEGADVPYRIWMNTSTGPDGEFTFEKIPIGVYTVMSGDEKLICKSVADVKVLPGCKAGPIILTQQTPVLVKGRVVLPADLEDTRYLALWFLAKETQNAQGKMVKISSDTGEFETKALAVGSHQAYFFGSFKKQFEPITVEVPPGGITNLVLTPVEQK